MVLPLPSTLISGPAPAIVGEPDTSACAVQPVRPAGVAANGFFVIQVVLIRIVGIHIYIPVACTAEVIIEQIEG